MGDKNVFVRVTVCEIPLVAVCDTGASVSFFSPKVFVRYPPKIQSSLKPCSKRLLAANQGEIRVKGEITVQITEASNTFRHFFVLEASEAECLLSLDFRETHKSDAMFSEMKLRLNRGTSANLFHRTAPVQSWHYPVMRVVARDKSFLLSGHAASILGEIDLDDHTFLKKVIFFWTFTIFRRQTNCFGFQHSSRTSRGCHPSTSTYQYFRRRSIDLQRLNTRNIHQPARQHVRPQQCIRSIKAKAHRNHQLWSQKHPPPSAASPEVIFPCKTCAVAPWPFCFCFSKNEWDIRKCDLVEHRIQVYASSTPVKLPNRRMPMHFKTDLQEKLDKILELEVIKPCYSPCSAPAMLVPKKMETEICHWLSAVEQADH